jgi:WXG100 family type VII secretion target
MTAPGQITYNFATMADATSAIDAAISSMRGTLDQLEADLRPLEGEAWSSEAQLAYKARKDRWNQASLHIVQILSQVKMALAASAERMQATDRRATNYFPS